MSTSLEIMKAKSVSYRCSKLKQTTNSIIRKTNQDGDTSRRAPQSSSETNANASIASTSSSAQSATQSVQRSRLGSRATRYVIIASQNSQSRPKDPESKDLIEQSGMPELSAREPLPHAEWDHAETLQPHPSERRQNDGLDFFRGLTNRSRTPRRYPPTSYRGPSSPLDSEDEQPLLHASEFNLPEPVSPAEGAIGSVAKLSNLEERRTIASPGTMPNSDDTITATYTRADTSYDRRLMASSSPGSSTSKSASCPGEGRRRYHYQQERSRPAQPPLPPPQEIYSQLMYYTKCPHTCPPAHRPLNVNPALQDLTPDLLRVPSSPAIASQLDLAARTGRPRQIYTIAGLCPDCDLHSRRAAESEVLAAFAERRRRCHCRCRRRRRRRRCRHSYQGNDEYCPLLAQLERDQDQQVKKIWTGFAARWGPGAIGIQRTTSSSSSSSSREKVEGRMKLDWLRPDVSKNTTCS